MNGLVGFVRTNVGCGGRALALHLRVVPLLA